MKIQELLHTLKSTISPFLHDQLFDRLGNELDSFLLNQVRKILNNYVRKKLGIRRIIILLPFSVRTQRDYLLVGGAIVPLPGCQP